MRALPFAKVSPGGNTTILLAASDLTPAQRALAVREILHPNHLGGEQAGFTDMDARRLEMAGGEFCVNATRAFGLLLALEGALEALPSTDGVLRRQGAAFASGMPDPVILHAARDVHGWSVEARLHFPEMPSCRRVEQGVTLVALPGITHLLVEADAMPPDWESASARLRRRHGLEECPAAGCVWWRRRDGGPRMDPVIRVREPHSLCYESACGSGALALALALNAEGERARSLAVMQPSGIPLEVRLEKRGRTLSAYVGGPVRLLARGHVFVANAPQDETGLEQPTCG